MSYSNSNLHITLTPFSNESRVLRETGSLVRSGITDRVFIVALHENGLPEHEDLDDTREVWRVKLRSRNWPKNLAVQLIKYLEFCWKVSRHAKRLAVDMVNIHTLDLLPVGVWLKLRLRAKLVFDTHELETETPGLAGMRQRLARLVERSLIPFVDLVIVVGPRIRDHYIKSYNLPSIVSVLNCPEYREYQKSDVLRHELNIPESAKIFLYLGNLSHGRGIKPLLRAFDGENQPDHILVIVGYGELSSVVRTYASRSKSIFFLPAVRPEQVLHYAASADVGVSLIEDTCLSYRYCLPNKLFEYAMAGIPILVSNLPEMATMIRECGIGEIVYELDANGINDAIRRLIAADQQKLHGNLLESARRLSWEHQEIEMIRAYSRHLFDVPK